VHGHAVAGGASADGQRLEKGRCVFVEADVEAVFVRVSADLVERPVVEVLRNGAPP
jgi:hypothetical protein